MRTSAIIASIGLAFVSGIGLERFLFSPRHEAASHASSSRSTARSVLSHPGLSAQGESFTNGRGSAEGRSDEDAPRTQARHLSELLGFEDDESLERALGDQTSTQLIAWLDELEKRADRSPSHQRLKRALFHQWAHHEPLQAIARVLGETDPRLQRDIIHHAFGRLAEEGQVSGALAALADLQTQRQRQEAIYALADRVSLEDMHSLASFLETHHPRLEVEPLYHRWAELEPGSAELLQFAASAGPRALQATARGLAHGNPGEALAWAQEVDEAHPGAHTVKAVLETMADWDPAQASQWLNEVPPGRQRQEMIHQIAHRWAEEDLSGTLDWMETLDPRSQNEALQSVSHHWARQDPAAAAEFAAALPPSAQRREALSEIAHVWAETDLNQASQWAETLGPDRQPALHGILTTAVEQDPQLASQLVARWSETAPPNAHRDWAGHLAGEWSEYDPVAASQWAESLPEHAEVQPHAIARVADHWVQQDSMAASEWIGNLPQGDSRNAATERLVDHVATSDPDSAYHWALSVADRGQQTDLLHHVFEQWKDLDPVTAQDTLQNAPLSSDQRQRLSQIFQPDSLQN